MTAPTRRVLVALVGVLAVAALVRLGAIAAIHEEPADDYLAYYLMASSLVEDGAMRDMFGNRAFYNAGYPLLVAGAFEATGVSVRSAQWLNLLLGLGSIALAFGLALRVFGSLAVATLAGLGLALYVEAAVFTVRVAKENLMIPLVLAQLCVAYELARGPLRPWLVALLGLLVGVQALAGNVGLVIVPIAAWALWRGAASRREFVAAAFVAALGAAVVAGPWIVRNAVVLGEPVLNTNGGMNLYVGNNPAATGVFVGLQDTPLRDRWQEVRSRQGELASDAMARDEALAWMRDNPGRVAVLAIRKAAFFWAPPELRPETTNAYAAARPGAGAAARIAWFAQYLLIVALAAWAVIAADRGTRARLGPILAYLGLFTAAHMAYYVIMRYRLPIMPLLIVLAAGGAHFAWRRLRPHRDRPSEAPRPP